ncbi:MAG: HEAT repeat domain-containing protein, partial [Candidatus Micrarchaeota archaeon]
LTPQKPRPSSERGERAYVFIFLASIRAGTIPLLLGKIRPLFSEIPKSKVLHNDIEGRFPHRVHDISDYMDFYALEKRLEERGIFSKPGHVKQIVTQKEEPPPELSDDDLKFYKDALRKGSPLNKEQVASDVYYLSQHHPSKFRDFVPICVDLLGDDNPDNRKTIIRLLDNLMTRSDDLRRDVISQAFDKIAALAEKDTNPQVRSYAYSFLSNSDDERSLDLLINALVTLTDQEYPQLNFQNIFIGWQWHVKRKLKKLLKRKLMEEMDKPHSQPILMRLKNIAGQLGV